MVRGRGASGVRKEGRKTSISKYLILLSPSSLFPLLSFRYEYPFERFEEVVTAYVGFLRDFAARHNGWTVTGAGVYFVVRVRRERGRGAGRGEERVV